jgi:hypothetical protein
VACDLLAGPVVEIGGRREPRFFLCDEQNDAALGVVFEREVVCARHAGDVDPSGEHPATRVEAGGSAAAQIDPRLGDGQLVVAAAGAASRPPAAGVLRDRDHPRKVRPRAAVTEHQHTLEGHVVKPPSAWSHAP